MARLSISNTVRIRTMVVTSTAVGAGLWLAPPSNVHLEAIPAVCVAVVLCTSWSLARRLPSVASGMLTASLATVCLLVLMQAGPSAPLWSPVILVPVLVARFVSGNRMALWSSLGVATMFCLGLYLSNGFEEALRVGSAGILWLALNVLSAAPKDVECIALSEVPKAAAVVVETRSADAAIASTAHDVGVSEMGMPRAALQQAARAIHQLVGSMLTSVDLIMDEVVDHGEASQDLRELRRSAHRASELAVRLMVVAHNQSPDPEKVDLGAHLSGLLPEIAALLGPDVQLELNVLPGLPSIHMDDRQLNDAISEIVQNASDAMGRKGVVRIGAFIDDTVPAGCVRLIVEDSGPGMSDTVRDSAFQPFFSTRGRGESAGLGLTVVQAIVAQAGGAVTLGSEQGVGTRVVMDLPRMAALHQGGSGLAGSVVVVGSDQGEAAVVAQLLRDRGHLVRFTTNASGGLQALSVASGQTELVIVEASDANLQFVRLVTRDWAHLDVAWLGRADPRLPPAVTVLDNIPVYCVVDELGKLAAA